MRRCRSHGPTRPAPSGTPVRRCRSLGPLPTGSKRCGVARCHVFRPMPGWSFGWAGQDWRNAVPMRLTRTPAWANPALRSRPDLKIPQPRFRPAKRGGGGAGQTGLPVQSASARLGTRIKKRADTGGGAALGEPTPLEGRGRQGRGREGRGREGRGRAGAGGRRPRCPRTWQTRPSYSCLSAGISRDLETPRAVHPR